MIANRSHHSALPPGLFTGACCLALLSLVCFNIAQAATPVVLIGPDLKSQAAQLQSLEQGRLQFFDAQRSLRSAQVNEFLQIRLGKQNRPEPKRDPGTVSVNLINGQRMIGTWDSVEDQGRTLVIRHALAGPLRVRLDDIVRITWGQAQAEFDQDGHDQVLLANGDRLSGFVTRLLEDGLAFQLAGSDQPATLSTNQLSCVVLANAPHGSVGADHLLYLADGSRLRVRDLSIDGQAVDGISFVPVSGTQPIRLATSQVVRVDLAGSAGRLVDLADLAGSVIEGGEVFGVDMRPRVYQGQWHLHAPVTLAFDLPEGARTFAATIQLESLHEHGDLQGTTTLGGDLNMVIKDGPRIRFQQRLYADNPRVTLSFPIENNQLVVELEAATNGPVGDAVVISSGMIYVAAEK